SLTPFLDSQSLREDQAITRPVDLDDFELKFFVFDALELRRRLLVLAAGSHFFALEVENLGDGYKAANTRYIDNQTTFVVIDDPCLEQFAVFVLIFSNAPLPFCICSLE